LLALLAALTLTACLTACGDVSSDTMSSGAFDDAAGGGSTSGGGLPPPDVEPPEIQFKYLAPRASRDYVFVPNASLDTVSKIDADSLAITTIPVGDRPSRVEAIDTQNTAVVLNQDSDEVSIIRADAILTPDGPADQEVRLRIAPRCNTLALSPDGAWAFAYFSFANQEDGEPIGNLQTLSVIRTASGEEAVFTVSVGFQVRAIQFLNDPDAPPEAPRTTSAFIITDTGLSVLDLATLNADAFLSVIPVTASPLLDPLDREVYVTASGDFAISRDRAEAAFHLVRLSDGALRTFPLPYPATDLDLIPGEDAAVVTVRDASLVLEVPIVAAFEDPDAPRRIDIGPEVRTLAAVDPTGRWLLLYSGLSERVTLVDRAADPDAPDARRVLRLTKAPLGVAMAPDGAHALIFHGVQGPVEGLSAAENLVRQRPGYSVLTLASGFHRLVASEVEVDDFTFWFDGQTAYGFVSFVDEARGLSVVERVALPSAVVQRIAMGSPVANLGRLAGRPRVWINQDHPLGRMTFINVADGTPRTITGFELNRRIQ
jgi:DNA-binding beta-propeller fold protein YncE